LTRITGSHWEIVIKLSPKNFRPGIVYAVVICLFLGPAVMVLSGCAAINLQSPPQEVKTFFVAGKEANYLSVLCLSPHAIDLSAYDQQMGIQYPPTLKVDVLIGPPSRPYKSFAVLECDPSSYANREKMLEGFKYKAQEIGADAIILCHAGPGQGPPEKRATQKMQAVAIKYKLTGK
jgi:hypothetical protein